jgi:5-methylcytosine-specific restriction enzyme A
MGAASTWMVGCSLRWRSINAEASLMPHAALKPCSYPGCSQLVRPPDKRCADHPAAPFFYRDPVRQKLYDRKWQQRRRVQLAAHPWCEECLRANIYEAATDVHHLVRHEGDPMKFISSPLESLCHVCHSRKTAEEINSKGRGAEKVSIGERRAGGAFGAKKFPNVENPD